MTTNDYIEKAKQAIATDQPNLAMLYMSRGMQDLDQRRLTHPYEMMFLGFRRLSLGCDRASFAIRDAFAAVHEEIAKMRESREPAH